jgi:hypothetical protein
VLTLENGICSAIGEDGGLDEIDRTIENLIIILNDIGNFEKDEMTSLKDTIEETVASSELRVMDTLDSAETYERWLPAYTVPMLVMGILLVAGAALSWFLPTTNTQFFVLQTWITLPLLIITIVGSVILAATLGPVLIANSGKDVKKV